MNGTVGLLLGLFYPKPAKRDTPAQYSECSRNMRSPDSVVCEGPYDEEDDRLYGEGKTVGDQDNRVDYRYSAGVLGRTLT